LAERLRLEFQRSTLTEKLAAYLMDTTMDGVTNTYNRTFFSERFVDELRRAERYGRVLSVALIEFLSLEDVYTAHGEEGRDYLMCAVASLMRGVLRNTDLLARYEEARFAIILPETSGAEADIACGKIKKSVEEFSFEFNGHKVPVRVGSAVSSTDELTGSDDGSETLLALAVERLVES